MVEEERSSRYKNKTSKFRGVTLIAVGHAKPWRAQIWMGGKAQTLGRFSTEEEAARAYDDAAREHHKENAVLNFPPGSEHLYASADKVKRETTNVEEKKRKRAKSSTEVIDIPLSPSASKRSSKLEGK